MLVIAGETIVDLIEFEPRRFEAFNGGGPYNVAKAAAKMQTETGYLSPISDDIFGDGFIEEMNALNLRALSSRSRQPSGLAIVKKDQNGHPTYSFVRDKAADRDISKDKLSEVMPKNARAFYIGGLALADGDDADIWCEFVSNISCPIFVDPNVRPSFIKDRDSYIERLHKIYDVTDYVKLSDEDIEWLAPNEDPRHYIERVMNTYNIKVGFLTEGSKGAHWLTPNGSGSVNIPKIEVVDTVGAGDCFSGATLSWILREDQIENPDDTTLQNALEYAVNAAAINCTRAGANAPTHEEILSF